MLRHFFKVTYHAPDVCMGVKCISGLTQQYQYGIFKYLSISTSITRLEAILILTALAANGLCIGFNVQGAGC